jgi:hypothetical protein
MAWPRNPNCEKKKEKEEVLQLRRLELIERGTESCYEKEMKGH